MSTVCLQKKDPPVIMDHTVIVDPTITKIIGLSDIHADMHSFIISLRDCSKVIKKKCFIFNPEELDQDMENLLEMDISNDDTGYANDLNYEWNCDNTHIVVCGDFLDGARWGKTSYQLTGKRTSRTNCGQNHDECISSEYPQIEIKLFPTTRQ